MSGESIEIKTIKVDIQENGIIRRADTGYPIGRLVDDYNFEQLSDYPVGVVNLPVSHQSLVESWTNEQLFAQLESCGYECEAGIMTMNIAYQELKQRIMSESPAPTNFLALGPVLLRTDEKGNLYIHVLNSEGNWDRMREHDTEKVTQYLKQLCENKNAQTTSKETDVQLQYLQDEVFKLRQLVNAYQKLFRNENLGI